MTAFMTWGWQEIRRERKNTACGVYSGLFIGRITSKEQCRSRVVPDFTVSNPIRAGFRK